MKYQKWRGFFNKILRLFRKRKSFFQFGLIADEYINKDQHFNSK